MNADNTDLNALSEKVLGGVFEVSNTLGAGFLGKVYQRALLRELSLRSIRATAEAALAVYKRAMAILPVFWNRRRRNPFTFADTPRGGGARGPDAVLHYCGFPMA